jgi:hypothetical protein
MEKSNRTFQLSKFKIPKEALRLKNPKSIKQKKSSQKMRSSKLKFRIQPNRNRQVKASAQEDRCPRQVNGKKKTPNFYKKKVQQSSTKKQLL